MGLGTLSPSTLMPSSLLKTKLNEHSPLQDIPLIVDLLGEHVSDLLMLDIEIFVKLLVLNLGVIYVLKGLNPSRLLKFPQLSMIHLAVVIDQLLLKHFEFFLH